LRLGLLEMAQRYYFSNKLAARKSRNRLLFAAAFLVLAFSAGSAWSHESSSSGKISAGAASVSSLPQVSLSVTDKCLPLLKSVRPPISPDNVTDKTQRPAGKLAALGLVFGIRFALGPVEAPQNAKRSAHTPALVDFRQPSGDINGRNALATAAYRHCRKTEALLGVQALHTEL
jgi:hypothetical protein